MGDITDITDYCLTNDNHLGDSITSKSSDACDGISVQIPLAILLNMLEIIARWSTIACDPSNAYCQGW